MVKQYKILAIKKRAQLNEFKDVISHVTYQVTAKKYDIEVVYTGECALSLPENTITPFNDLTEENVILWILGVINVEKLDEMLLKLILAKKYPIIESKLPW
jgi:hypothetical protein